MEWTKLASDKILERTAESLRKNGIEVYIAENREEAKKKVLELIPEGSEVMNNSSATLDAIGVSKEIMESGKYVAVRKIITNMNDEKQRQEFRRKSATVDYDIGSVQAIIEDGQIVIASNSGSQLSPIASSAVHVILVVGTQKIVKNLGQAFKRIEEHSLPLESERLKKLYGIQSKISKILIINRETKPDRMKLIFVKENLGF
jgi:L-lactate utilization protein LutB